MRLTVILAGDDLFVQGEFPSAYGVHSKRLTEDLPDEVFEAARTLALWANDNERDLQTLIEKTEERAALQNFITLLTKRLEQVNG